MYAFPPNVVDGQGIAWSQQCPSFKQLPFLQHLHRYRKAVGGVGDRGAAERVRGGGEGRVATSPELVALHMRSC